MIRQAAGVSILGRASDNGYIQVDTMNIRDFSDNRYMRVDDYPYGGGAGMVIQAEPVFRAVQKAKETLGENTRVVYMTPQAKVLDQTKVEELALEENLILLCGHYEGIDERVLREVATDYVSIGDYVLTGGELGALVLMDAVSRFVPGVLSNEESSQFESLQDNLLEYPHYTRPQVWHEQEVPPVLLSGDHKKVLEWRYEQSLQRTKERRPDLLENGARVTVIFLGAPEGLAKAEAFCAELSRYGSVLDYNRAKLQKGKRRFSAGDFLIFFLNGDAQTADFAAAVRNLRGQDTEAVLLFAGDEDKADRPGEVQTLKDVLEKRGIRLRRNFAFSDDSGERQRKETALEIRRIMQARGAAGENNE